MYLYRCRLLYSKAIMDFYSNNYYQISPSAIVKLETKHGVDLGIYLNKVVNIDDKEFDEILKYQATTVEENIENIENSQEFLNGIGLSESNGLLNLQSVQTKIMSTSHDNEDMKDKEDKEINEDGKDIKDKENLNESYIESKVFFENKENQEKTGSDKINKKRQIRIEGRFISIANSEDLKIYKENEEKAKEAFLVFKEEIRECGLEHEMKPVGVHYFLDGMKILFDFVADHRIDFRELVKKLAAKYRKRIELHQIGVRDEARMIDGLFICGQQLCCRRFLHQLTPISIKMAEVQNAPLNTMKISGYCGRLLCCLAYEAQQYEEAKENLPDVGTSVIYNNEKYLVAEVNVIKQYLKIKKKDSMEYILLKNDPLVFEKDKEGNIVIKKCEIYISKK